MFHWGKERCEIQLFSPLCLVAEAALSQCDMAEELSRQLEDILSTYCRESISDDASALLNGQSHSPVLNGLTSEREDDKPEEDNVNGSERAEKEQKKSQDKKKVKGLGKEESSLSYGSLRKLLLVLHRAVCRNCITLNAL